MYDRQFFSTRLGKAALASIAAMVTFNLVTLIGHIGAPQATVAYGTLAGTLA